jgi:hypothetical protein
MIVWILLGILGGFILGWLARNEVGNRRERAMRRDIKNLVAAVKEEMQAKIEENMFDDFLGKNLSDVKPILEIKYGNVRTFYPDTVATDDYIETRLNVRVDDAGKIIQIYYG